MPKPYTKEFRDDVVTVARKGQAPLNQIARDFGISEGCLHGWMKKADVEDGSRPGLSDADRVELLEARKKIRLLEQENEVLRRVVAYLSQANLPDKQSLPLVREMAATGARIRVPVAVACRVSVGNGGKRRCRRPVPRRAARLTERSRPSPLSRAIGSRMPPFGPTECRLGMRNADEPPPG